MLRSNTCTIAGCGSSVVARGLCNRHHCAWRRHGDPTVRLSSGPKRKTMLERILALTSLARGIHCWVWFGATNRGYGGFALDRRTNRKVHRVLYELLVGPIPDDLQLDHRCRNRSCVNPAHLEPVTSQVNIQRGWEFRNAA